MSTLRKPPWPSKRTRRTFKPTSNTTTNSKHVKRRIQDQYKFNRLRHTSSSGRDCETTNDQRESSIRQREPETIIIQDESHRSQLPDRQRLVRIQRLEIPAEHFKVPKGALSWL